MLRLPLHRRLAIVLVCALPGAWAEEPKEADAPRRAWVLGADLASQPEYAGSGLRVLKVRPLWAYQYGRFRISTPGAGSVLGLGTDTRGPGASSELISTDHFRFGVALRFDGGRQSSESSDLDGLPDIRRTVRGRFYASYKLSPDWNLGASLSQDLLGRKGGATAAVDLSYHRRLSAATTGSIGAGVTMADSRYMKTYFGVAEEDAARSGLEAFEPGASLRDFHTGVNFTTQLSERWVLFAGAGISTLLRDAAASPLTKNSTTRSVHVGLAYRCCR